MSGVREGGHSRLPGTQSVKCFPHVGLSVAAGVASPLAITAAAVLHAAALIPYVTAPALWARVGADRCVDGVFPPGAGDAHAPAVFASVPLRYAAENLRLVFRAPMREVDVAAARAVNALEAVWKVARAQ